MLCLIAMATNRNLKSICLHRCENHKHQLCACCCGTSFVPATSGLLHVAGTAGTAGREDPWTELLLYCRARLTLKLRMGSARAALVRVNSVCSARVCRAGASRSLWPLGLEHCVFQPCLSFQNGNFHIDQNSTNSIEGVLFPLIVN